MFDIIFFICAVVYTIINNHILYLYYSKLESCAEVLVSPRASKMEVPKKRQLSVPAKCQCKSKSRNKHEVGHDMS